MLLRNISKVEPKQIIRCPAQFIDWELKSLEWTKHKQCLTMEVETSPPSLLLTSLLYWGLKQDFAPCEWVDPQATQRLEWGFNRAEWYFTDIDPFSIASPAPFGTLLPQACVQVWYRLIAVSNSIFHLLVEACTSIYFILFFYNNDRLH